MSSARNLTACVAGVLMAVPAFAFAQMQPSPPPADIAAPPPGPAPIAAPPNGGDPGGVRMEATQFPPDQARALAQGDNAVVTNGPIPDTPANRAKYGKPLSHAGKVSPPEGN